MPGPMRLYRPVGLREWELIVEAGRRAFPPRLFHQPIFYPVLTYEYAVLIARDWNVTDDASGFVGIVTEFDVEGELASRYPPQLAGGKALQELWVPAEELAEFNAHIVGEIRSVAAWTGPRYQGPPIVLTHPR